MKGPDAFIQAYNAQAVVNAESQVIVAQTLSDRPTDVALLGEMVGQIKSNIGRQAQEFSADAGYSSEGNMAILARSKVRGVCRHRKAAPRSSQDPGAWPTSAHSGDAPASGTRGTSQPLSTAQANGRAGIR